MYTILLDMNVYITMTTYKNNQLRKDSTGDFNGFDFRLFNFNLRNGDSENLIH